MTELLVSTKPHLSQSSHLHQGQLHPFSCTDQASWSRLCCLSLAPDIQAAPTIQNKQNKTKQKTTGLTFKIYIVPNQLFMSPSALIQVLITIISLLDYYCIYLLSVLHLSLPSTVSSHRAAVVHFSEHMSDFFTSLLKTTNDQTQYMISRTLASTYFLSSHCSPSPTGLQP